MCLGFEANLISNFTDIEFAHGKQFFGFFQSHCPNKLRSGLSGKCYELSMQLGSTEMIQLTQLNDIEVFLFNVFQNG